ncbi:hypothetical protein THRCLA_20998 [Thraustotheca clavata]|uniref:J domain-containing protein n=1 Tax=Thraustotheca clavata TaxID=74557 RepID=A0A1W0A173_9STRA|nr:hypothetical protein THRCLA_20998 [Thraustotheca clavata]
MRLLLLLLLLKFVSGAIVHTRYLTVQGQTVALPFTDDVEPIDTIEAFREQYNLSYIFQQQTLNKVCSVIRCTRSIPVVYSVLITTDESKGVVGTFKLLAGEEPVDAIATFCKTHQLSRDFQQSMIESICQQPRVVCTRREALLFQQIITSDDGSSLGMLKIFDGAEPVDQIFAFLHPWFPDVERFRAVLIQLVEYICSRIPCEQTIPRLYHKLIQGPNDTNYGWLDIYYGQEPIDVISQLNLDRSMELSLLNTVCAEPLVQPSCTRDRVIVFSSPIQFDDTSQPIPLTLYAGDEVADAVYQLGQQYNLSMEMRHGLFNALCNRPPITCTRGRALIYKRVITDTEGKTFGALELFDGDDAADRVYEFANAYNLTIQMREAVLNNICHDIQNDLNITCSRFAPLIASIPIQKDASDPNPLGYVNLQQGEEPVDAVYRFGVQHNLDATQQESIWRGICDALQFPCTRSRSLVHIAILDNEQVPFFGDEEPADVLYWFGTQKNWSFHQRQDVLHQLCQIERAAKPLLNCTRSEARLFHLPVMETETEKLGTLEVFEDQEPVDVVYAFMDKHDLFQTAPINTSLINITCSNVHCVRNRPRRILFSLQATYMGLPYKIEYTPPEDEWICTETEHGKKCEHYVEARSASYCAKYMRTWPNCPEIISKALRTHLDIYEAAMWRGKDLYAKLGLVKGATSDEIEHAYHTRVLRYNNATEPQKYEKLQAAYDTLHDPEKKYYYDLPCMKFFGLCGKRQPDGGISITTDN